MTNSRISEAAISKLTALTDQDKATTLLHISRAMHANYLNDKSDLDTQFTLMSLAEFVHELPDS